MVQYSILDIKQTPSTAPLVHIRTLRKISYCPYIQKKFVEQLNDSYVSLLNIKNNNNTRKVCVNNGFLGSFGLTCDVSKLHSKNYF